MNLRCRPMIPPVPSSRRPPQDGNIYREHFESTGTVSLTQGEGTSELHPHSQRSLLLIFLIGGGEPFHLSGRFLHGRGWSGSVPVQTASCFITLFYSPLSISVCFLIACYTVGQDHVTPSHTGLWMSPLHSRPFTLILGCVELPAGLLMAFPLLLPLTLNCLSLCRWFCLGFNATLCLFSFPPSSYFCWSLDVMLVWMLVFSRRHCWET